MSEIDDPMFAGLAEPEHMPGPYVEASFDGECSRCLGDILAGDEIRADGDGEWEHRYCAEYDQGDEREAIGQPGWDDDWDDPFDPDHL